MVKLVIVGCGSIARKRHAPACRAYGRERVELGYFDPVIENARKLSAEYGGEIYASFKAVLQDQTVDAISVCTPEKYHCDMVTACLEAGKHVLCEKPMAMDAGQARQMAQVQAEAGKVLAVAFSQRHYAEYRTAKKLLKEGAIGKVLMFRTALANSGVEHFVSGDAGSFYDKCLENVGGVMTNVGCHRVDLVQWLFERKIEQVLAYTPTLDKHFSDGRLITVEDTAMVICKLQGDIAGTLWASWCNYGGTDADTQIFGTQGSMKISPEGGIVLEKADGTRINVEVEKQEQQKAGYDVVWDFLDFLTTNKMVAADVSAGLSCMEVMEAIKCSNASGTWETVR